MRENLGWELRAGASLDGGQTFSASVPVTQYANSYSTATSWDVAGFASSDSTHSLISMGFGLGSFFTSGGHTSGMAVDSEGRFFPTWIDNHTGISQLWSAAVSVKGDVTKNGAPELARLEDVSKWVTLEVAKTQLNRATRTMTVTARLKNTPVHTIRGTIKLRQLNLRSGLGVPQI